MKVIKCFHFKITKNATSIASVERNDRAHDCNGSASTRYHCVKYLGLTYPYDDNSTSINVLIRSPHFIFKQVYSQLRQREKHKLSFQCLMCTFEKDLRKQSECCPFNCYVSFN